MGKKGNLLWFLYNQTEKLYQRTGWKWTRRLGKCFIRSLRRYLRKRFKWDKRRP